MTRIVKLGVGIYRRVEVTLDVEIGVWERTGRPESQALSFSAAELSKYLGQEAVLEWKISCIRAVNPLEA